MNTIHIDPVSAVNLPRVQPEGLIALCVLLPVPWGPNEIRRFESVDAAIAYVVRADLKRTPLWIAESVGSARKGQ